VDAGPLGLQEGEVGHGRARCGWCFMVVVPRRPSGPALPPRRGKVRGAT
jgi:hypothetical protein